MVQTMGLVTGSNKPMFLQLISNRVRQPYSIPLEYIISKRVESIYVRERREAMKLFDMRPENSRKLIR
jgi:hypothetical protein